MCIYRKKLTSCHAINQHSHKFTNANMIAWQHEFTAVNKIMPIDVDIQHNKLDCNHQNCTHTVDDADLNTLVHCAYLATIKPCQPCVLFYSEDNDVLKYFQKKYVYVTFSIAHTTSSTNQSLAHVVILANNKVAVGKKYMVQNTQGAKWRVNETLAITLNSDKKHDVMRAMYCCVFLGIFVLIVLLIILYL